MHDNTDMEHEAGFLAGPLVALTRFCGRHPWMVICGVVVSCALALTYTAYRLTYLTHRNDLISQQKDYYQRWKKYVKEFGDDEDLVVVLESASRERQRPEERRQRPEMVAVLEEIAARIQADPKRFDRLNYKVDLR